MSLEDGEERIKRQRTMVENVEECGSGMFSSNQAVPQFLDLVKKMFVVYQEKGMIGIPGVISFIDDMKELFEGFAESELKVLLISNNEEGTSRFCLVTFSTKSERDFFLKVVDLLSVSVTAQHPDYQTYIDGLLVKEVKQLISGFLKGEIDEKGIKEFLRAPGRGDYSISSGFIHFLKEKTNADELAMFLNQDTPLIRNLHRDEIKTIDGKIHTIRHVYDWY